MDWTFGVTALSIVGVVANIYKRRWCFWVWTVTNATWCVVDFRASLYGQALLFAVYFALAVWGLMKWEGSN